MIKNSKAEEIFPNYTRELAQHLTNVACKRYLAKLKRLDGNSPDENEKQALHDWHRDDSFLGNRAEHHIEYKLGEPLISRDGTRAYEFLIEFDVDKPSIGIYYGVKGLVLSGNLNEQINQFINEFYGMSMEEIMQNSDMSDDNGSLRVVISRYLNATFPGKDFSQRFRFTDNANNNTFWPFWIAADVDEDIIWETARAVAIIRRIYKERADVSNNLFELSDVSCSVPKAAREKLICLGEVESPKKKCPSKVPKCGSERKPYLDTIRFTHASYNSFIEKLGSDRAREIFNKLMSNLVKKKMLNQSTLLECGYEIAKGNNKKIACVLRMFWDSLGMELQKSADYEHFSDLLEDAVGIFLPENLDLLKSKTFIGYANDAKDVMKSTTPKDDEIPWIRELKIEVMKAKCIDVELI